MYVYGAGRAFATADDIGRAVAALRSGGLVAYGGFLGGFLSAWLFWRIKKIPLIPFADIAVPTLASGLMLTRVGCYLYGCDYGRPLGEHAAGFLKSAGTFPKWDSSAYPSFACDQTISGSPAYQHHLNEGLLPEDAVASLAVHPTQIYESVAGLALFAFSFWLLNNRKFRGQVLVTVGALYGLWRFFIEYLRDDPERARGIMRDWSPWWGPGGRAYLEKSVDNGARIARLKPVRFLKTVAGAKWLPCS